MLRYLIWDVDGTLFDTYPAFVKAFGLALDEIGATAPPGWIDDLCRQSLSHCVSTLAREFEVDPDELARRFRTHYAAIPAQDQPPFPGVMDVCSYVRAIEGENYIVTHRGGLSLAELLAAHHVRDYFADCLNGDGDYPRKPDPASFEAIIDRYYLEREETLAIGDRDIDILAGRAAGVRTCWFGPAQPEVAADYAVTDYAQLGRLLRAENSGQTWTPD
jgi:phosphoglycolate phosphatase-like HAD superfamily hydrolase